MKRLILFLAGIGAVCAISSCTKEAEKLCPVTDISISSPATIGDYLEITGTGFATDAALSLRPTSGSEVALSGIEATNSGVKVLIPTSTTPGAHTVVLSQDGIWEIGQVLLQEAQNPITDCVLPSVIKIGGKLEIACSGFPEGGKIILRSGDKSVELASVITSTGAECEVPASVTVGDWDVVLKVNLNEWILGSAIPAVVFKRIASLKIDQFLDAEFDDEGLAMAAGMFGVGSAQEMKDIILSGALGMAPGTEEIINAGYSYDDQGRVIKLAGKDQSAFVDLTYNTDNTVGVQLNHAATSPLFGDLLSCTWTLNDAGMIGHAVCNYKGEDAPFTYDWVYDDDIACLRNIYFGGTSTLQTAIRYDENGNINFFYTLDEYANFATYDLSKKVNIFSVDLTKVLAIGLSTNGSAMDPDVALANLLGLSGPCSKNVPTALNVPDGSGIVTCPVTATLDDDGYCTYLKGGFMSLPVLPGCTFTIGCEFTFVYE